MFPPTVFIKIMHGSSLSVTSQKRETSFLCCPSVLFSLCSKSYMFDKRGLAMRKMYLGQVRCYEMKSAQFFQGIYKKRCLIALKCHPSLLTGSTHLPIHRTPHLQLYPTGGFFEFPEPYELPESFKSVLKAVILILNLTAAVSSHCTE